MQFHHHSTELIVPAGEELTVLNARRFHASVELAAAVSDHVIIDVTHTRMDSWAYLELLALHEELKPRVVVAAPPEVCAAFAVMRPPVDLPLYDSIDKARHAFDQ